MLDFTAMVRLHEGVLSPASILGLRGKRKNLHNEMEEHELARARAAFQCSAERQGRHQVWMTFQERVLSDLKQDEKEALVGAQPIKQLEAPSGSKDGQRTLQLIVVRPFQADAGVAGGGLRLAMPIHVWRCGRSGEGATARNKKQKLVLSAAVPIATVTKLHVMLFMPIKGEEGEHPSLVATCLGYCKRLLLDVVGSGSV